MPRTLGMTHIALAVRDAQRSLRFYEALFDVVVEYEDEQMLQVQTPGTSAIIVFEKNAAAAGKQGGVAHFGFRLAAPEDIAAIKQAGARIGAKVLREGEFAPGLPYIYFEDPDGYEIEVWYETPTAADPPAS